MCRSVVLDAYVPILPVGGQVIRFLHGHLGHDIASPALLGQIGTRFRGAVKRFAKERGIPILALKKPDRSRWDDRKLDHVRPYLQEAEREGPLRGGRDRRLPGVPARVLGPQSSASREGGEL